MHNNIWLLTGLLILESLLLRPAAAIVRGTSFGEQKFDCIIEPRRLVKLASPVVGVIARLDVDRGDHVRAGQVIGKLEDGVEAANLAIARARSINTTAINSNLAHFKFLSRKLGRTSELTLKGAATAAALDEASADARVAEEQFKEAQFNLDLAKLEALRAEEVVKQRILRSPFDGVVVERLLQPGEYRNEQTPIITLAEIDPLRVEVFIPTQFYGEVHVGDRALVQPEEPIGGIHSAIVIVVDPVLDAASGTFGVRLELPNPEQLLPAGLKCKIAFKALSGSVDGSPVHPAVRRDD